MDQRFLPLNGSNVTSGICIRAALDFSAPDLIDIRVIVVIFECVGDAVPALTDASLLKILHASYDGTNPKPEILWVSEPPPAEFELLGSIPESETLATLERIFNDRGFLRTMESGPWENLADRAITHWRWQNDREALLADWATEEQEHSSTLQVTADESEQHLPIATLDELSQTTLFADWHDYPKLEAIEASRKLIRDLVLQLLELGDAGNARQKQIIMKSCVDAFNALNERFGGFIDTDLREQIVAELVGIGLAAGLSSVADHIDEWRDW